MDTKQLAGWQKDVIDYLEQDQALRESDTYLGCDLYNVNKELQITVSYPVTVNHTEFAAYLGSKFPCLIVYRDIAHYMELYKTIPHPETDYISLFEIYFVYSSGEKKLLSELNDRFRGKKAVVVDQFEKIPNLVKDFLLYTVNCGIVFLGK